MTELRQPWVVFRVDGRRYALPLSVVERVERAAAPLPLPGAPDGIAGALNLHGRILPLAEARNRLDLPPRAMIPADQMLVVADSLSFLLLVDAVEEVLETSPDRFTPVESVCPGGTRPGILGILEDPEAGLVLMCTPGVFVQPEGRAVLAATLQALTGENSG